MKLIPWRDRGGLTSFRGEFDDLLSRFTEGEFDSRLPAAFRRTSAPPVNVSETDKYWTVAVELPGLNEKDIDVQVRRDELVISGERRWEGEKKGEEYQRVECHYGAFQRAISLPENLRLDPDSIRATYKRGMLEVTLEKVEPTPAAKIQVKAGD